MKKITIALAGLLLGTALPALAVTGSVGVDANAKVEVGGSASSSASGSAGANGSANGGAQGSISGDAQGSGSATISIPTHVYVRGSGDGTVTVSSSDQVMTTADLEAYAQAVIDSDEHVDRVETGEKAVTVAYKQHARLFGMIPVLITVRAQANADGTVTVRYPWYSFLLSKNKAQLEADVKSSVGSALNSRADEHAALTAQENAALIAKMRSALRARFEAETSASANASANAK